MIHTTRTDNNSWCRASWVMGILRVDDAMTNQAISHQQLRNSFAIAVWHTYPCLRLCKSPDHLRNRYHPNLVALQPASYYPSLIPGGRVENISLFEAYAEEVHTVIKDWLLLLINTEDIQMVSQWSEKYKKLPFLWATHCSEYRQDARHWRNPREKDEP